MDRVGRYRLDHLIGLGASGSVWQASEPGAPGRPVAIKRLRETARAAARERFHAEASALAALDHPHIVALLDLVEDGPDLAIVMPLACGGSLHDLLAERTLTPGEVAALLAPVADALACAHGAGLRHGDVRASNVLLTADGQPLLADFGSTAPGGPVGADEDEDVRTLADLVRRALGPAAATVEARAVAAAADRRGAAAVAAALRQAAPSGSLPGPALARHGGAPVTRDFGPRPPRRPAPARRSARRALGAGVGSVALALTLGTVALWAGARSQPADPQVRAGARARRATACPRRPSGPHRSGGSPSWVDLAGDGCPVPVWWEQGTIEVGAAAGDPGVRRYDLGDLGPDRPDDLGTTLLAGDWDCDGAQGIAVVEPERGRAYLFDRLPEAGVRRPDGEVVLRGAGVAHVVRHGRCDVVEPGPRPVGSPDHG